MIEETNRYLNLLTAHDRTDARPFFATIDDSGQGRKALLSERSCLLEQHSSTLERLNANGAGVFVCVNETDDSGKRRAGNVVRVRALFVDLDGSPLDPVLPYSPSLVVETSPNRWHAYWLVSDCPLDRFKPLQQALARRFGGDPTVCDLPRLVRLPGFEHRKRDPHPVTITQLGDATQRTVAELTKLLGLETETKRKATPVQRPRAEPYALAALSRECRSVAEADEGTRNVTLNRAAFSLGQLVSAGALSESQVVSELSSASQLDENETATTIRSGLTAGYAAPRDLTAIGRRAEVTDSADSKPPPPPEILERDSDTCFARHLEAVYTHELGVTPIATAGSVWGYDRRRGIWAEIDDDTLGKRIQSLDGRLHAYVWKDGVKKTTKDGEIVTRLVPVDERTRRDASSALKTMLSQPSFFAQARQGFGFSNGFVSIRDGRVSLTDHSPDNRARACWPFAYDPDAPCDRWFRFLTEIWDGHADVSQRVRFLSEFIGACLTGTATRFQRCLVLPGDGSNGKSVLVSLIRKLFPLEASRSTSPQSWNELGRGEYHRAKLDGALINIVSELPERDVADSDSFKAVISGDAIDGRHPAGRPFSFTPRAGHVFAANALPAVRDSSHGFWRRFTILTFDRVFDGSVNADDLGRELEAEIPGILAWALEGAAQARARGRYTDVPSSAAAVDEWRLTADQVATWVAECGVRLEGEWRAEAGATAREVYGSYTQWAADNGHRPPLSSGSFGRRLRQVVGCKRLPLARHYGVRLKHTMDA